MGWGEVCVARLRCQVLSLSTLSSRRGAFVWLLDGLPKLQLLKWWLKAETPLRGLSCEVLAPVPCLPSVGCPLLPAFRESAKLPRVHGKRPLFDQSESVAAASNQGSPLHATETQASGRAGQSGFLQ